MTISNVKVTIALSETGIDAEELQAEVENLLPQIREVDGVEEVDLVAVTETPDSSKALGGFLLGMLTAEVNPANLKTLFKFLSDRLSGKTIELEVEKKDGDKLKIKASSQAEFEFAMQKAKEFLES
jgi:hypothetical protein